MTNASSAPRPPTPPPEADRAKSAASWLIDATARRFVPAGLFARRFARAKLLHDPVYLALLRRGLIGDGLRLLDLGCGQGILLALLAVAPGLARAGLWPPRWPPPPVRLRLRGIEREAAEVRRARLALGSDGEIELRDLRDPREGRLEPSDLIALLDVIHYLEPSAQERLLAEIAEALAPRGLLLMRVCDGGAGLSARLTRAADRLGTLSRGRLVGRLHTRSVSEWIAALDRLGLVASAEPAGQGTPFANVLILGRRAAG